MLSTSYSMDTARPGALWRSFGRPLTGLIGSLVLLAVMTMPNTLLSRILISGATAADADHEIVLNITDIAGRPLADAVAYLTQNNTANPSSAALAPNGTATIVDQVNRQFTPFVSIVQTGTAIHFPNSDNIRHSVYSFSPAKTFTLKLYSGIPAEPIVFDQAGLVTLGCNIHDQMLAYVKVVNTPYFGKSGADGKIVLTRPPGERWQLQLWHPWLAGNEPERTIDSTTTLPVTLALKLQPPVAAAH
jgi:plastocyanin